MNQQPGFLRRMDETGVPSVLARLILCALFIYTGYNKAMEPYDFLKLLREYHMFAPGAYKLMNFVAIVLPWLEIFCGVLLFFGVAVRGTALLLAGMLIAFTTAVVIRAIGVHNAQGIAFCAIKFDCGCGTGPVNICKKLVENSGLILLSLMLLWCRTTLTFTSLLSPKRVNLAGRVRLPVVTPPAEKV